MASDFTALYSSLGVDPDCEVDTLKRLFRRRIAELHPDRGARLSEEELMMLYLEALRFHRRHGRFPGARVPAATIRSRPAGHWSTQGDAATVVMATAQEDASRRQAMTIIMLTLLGLALLGVGVWAIDDAEPITAGTGPPNTASG